MTSAALDLSSSESSVARRPCFWPSDGRSAFTRALRRDAIGLPEADRVPFAFNVGRKSAPVVAIAGETSTQTKAATPAAHTPARLTNDSPQVFCIARHQRTNRPFR